MELKIAALLIFSIFLISPLAAWSQDVPIKIDSAPLLSVLDHRNWYDLHNDTHLADAVRAALSRAPFQSVPGPAADVLTLSLSDRVRTENKEYIFTVVFMRDGEKLGEAVETCPVTKLTDCTNQLILDAKTAAR